MQETSTRSPGFTVVTPAPTYGPDSLVTQDRPGSNLGHIALEDVEVGSADRRRVDPNDRIGRLLDRRIRHPLPGSLTRSVTSAFMGSSFVGHCHSRPACASRHRRPTAAKARLFRSSPA
jgi:hypothetical protein